MRTCLIFRHGIPEKEGYPGKECKLSEVGAEGVKSAAMELKKRGLTLDCVMTSPYRRAIQTAEILAHIMAAPTPFVEQALSYEFDEDALLNVLHGIDFEHIALVGHSPSLIHFCNRLLEKEQITRLPQGSGISIAFKDRVMQATGKILYKIPR